MIIRNLETNDLDALLALYTHLNPADAPVPPTETVEAVWSKSVSSRLVSYYGCFLGSDLVSSCSLAIIPNLTRACSPYGIIENVVTHADFRRRGFASSILHKALEDAWLESCYKVMLLTGQMDDATLRFYENAGFDPNEKQAFVARPPQ